MIGRVVSRPKRPHRLLAYLFGPGRDNEHANPRLAAAWSGDPTPLEPPGTGTSGRRTYRLAQLLEVPVAQARGKVPKDLVWHCVLRAASSDPDLRDIDWQETCAELMHRVGLSEYGQEHKGVRWVAVHHGDNHVHVVAVLARMDGRPVRLKGDYYRVQETMAWAEKKFGLTPVARAGARGTATRRPTRAETEKAARLGRPAPARTELRRLVEAAAAAARTEEEFFTGLTARGVAVQLRESTLTPGEVTGYAAGLQSDTTGTDGGPVWFRGSGLAPDLSLPRLRARWATGPGRLSGQAMSLRAARPVLAREVFRAARAARSEQHFFTELALAGLFVDRRSSPDRPGTFTGYMVSLPGLVGRDGQAAWFAGSTLDPQLGQGQLRARWAAGRAGAAPGADQFDGASTAQVYAYAAAAAQQAATDIKTTKGHQRADIAWAAADLLTAAAWATGNIEVHRAAEGFRRAARAPWGRSLAPTPSGTMLRTAAYLLAGCMPLDKRSAVRRALVAALSGLARAVTEMRHQRMLAEQAKRARQGHARHARDAEAERKGQVRSLQAEAAHQAATRLAAVAGPTWGADPAAAAAAAASQTMPSRPGRPGQAAHKQGARR